MWEGEIAGWCKVMNKAEMPGGFMPADAGSALSILTQAERRILRLVAEDRTSVEIAGLLGVSPRTVENHRTNICRKIGLRGNNALLRYALCRRAQL